jgi:hypothetical protein
MIAAEIGTLVTNQITKALGADTRIAGTTRRRLLACLKSLSRGVENMCPVMLAMSSKGLDDRFHETSPLQLVPLARKTLLFRRPDMIRILEAPD